MKQKELMKNTIIIFLGKISTQFLSFLLLPLYTAYINTSEYGTVDLIITYISLIIPIITIQQEMAVFRFLVDARRNEKEIKSVISSSISIILKLITFFAIIYIIIIHYINIQYKLLIIINAITCIFVNFLLQIARGLGKNVNFSIGSLISGTISIISNIILIIFLDFGANAILISMAIGNSIGSIYLFLSLNLYKYISLKQTNKQLKKELVKYSLPLIPNGVSWWIVNVSDRTIISLFLGVSANGIYAIASKFPSIISSFFHIFSLSWTESASIHINDTDRDIFFTYIFKNVINLFSCLCIGLIACLSLLFPILINQTYNEAYIYIPILILGSLFNCIVGVYSAIYIAKKSTKQVANTSLMAAFINIIINFCLIKYIGLYAASISTAIAYGTMMIYRAIDAKKYVNIKYDWKMILRIAILFIIGFICYYINKLCLNIIWLALVIIFSIMINKDLIIKIFSGIKYKLNSIKKKVYTRDLYTRD